MRHRAKHEVNPGDPVLQGMKTMAADTDMQAHRATYAKVIAVMKYGAVAVFIIALAVVWLISGK